MTNNVDNSHLIKFNDMLASLYKPGWDRIKLITIVIGARDMRVNFLRSLLRSSFKLYDVDY